MLDVSLSLSFAWRSLRRLFLDRGGVLLAGLGVAWCAIGTASAQQHVLTLQECQRLLQRHGSLAGQDTLVMVLGREQREEVKLSYLPRLALVGQLSYQSDVPHLDLPPLPIEIDMPDKDQRALYVQVHQPIWDGGLTYARSRVVGAETDKRMWESRLAVEKLHRQVEHLYYSILLIDRQLAVQRLGLESIVRNARRIDTLQAYGVASGLDARHMEIERLRLQQEIEQSEHARQGSLASLSQLVGVPIPPDAQLEMPLMPSILPNDSVERIELKVQDAEVRMIAARQSALEMTLTPKLSLYGQAGYAKPGPNIFNHEFASFYHVGVQLRWDLDALYSYMPHRRALRVQRAITEKGANAFRQGVSAELAQLWHAYHGLGATLRKDSALVSHCEAIKHATELRLEQGVATTYDLLTSLTQWQGALLRQALHAVQRARMLAQIRGVTKGWWYE